jgi:hypothetical protein
MGQIHQRTASGLGQLGPAQQLETVGVPPGQVFGLEAKRRAGIGQVDDL